MSQLNREYSEKRDFIRMKINAPAQVTMVEEDRTEEDNTVRNAVCHDLSGGGMLLTLDQELALDTELIVTVTSVHGHSPILQARCAVARVEQGPKQSYMLGLEIQEVIENKKEEPEAETE